MKIVFFSSDNNKTSGAFRAECELIQDLVKRGHDVVLTLPYHGSGTKYAKSKSINTKFIFSIYWVSFYPKTLFDFLFYYITLPINWIAKFRTKKFLKKEKFDLVVMNTAWNGLGAEVANKLNIPIVWHLREKLEAQMRCFYKPKKCTSVMKKSYKMIPVSSSVLTHYLKYFSKDKMQIIYDGIDPQKFFHQHKPLFQDKTVHIISVGRVNKYKGYIYMIQALNGLSEFDFDYTVVGFYTPAYKDYLMSKATNIKERVHFVGPTDNVSNYYQKADVLLMGSIGEAFGLAIAEAMMEGVAVASSKCDGGLEIIQNESNGYFFKPGDIEDMKNTLRDIFNNKEEAQKRALAGQAHAYETFQKSKNTDAIEQIYFDAIREKKENV